MRNRKVLLAVLALTLQAVCASGRQLTVQAENGKQTILTRADIEALPRVKITTGASATSTTFEGVALKAVLERGGVEFGENMGKAPGLLFASGSCRRIQIGRAH